MIPRECRRLAEVDFPIAAVSTAAVAKEKRFPVPRGLPSTMHHWWARRPLASSRAMLLSLLFPDPGDALCPENFRAAVERLLVDVPQPAPWHYTLRTGEGRNEGLRRVLLGFVADFADWNSAANPVFLKASRELVRVAHGEQAPLVVDPFAGGGSIPLEALRVGCDAFASDLNPVACLILKVLLETIPRGGPALSQEVLRLGEAIRESVEGELRDLYPPEADGAQPVAYLWSRIVRCEAAGSPGCGAEIPLLRSFWLSRKRRQAVRPLVNRDSDGLPVVDYEIFSPESGEEVHPATVSRARATCLACRDVLPPDRVRAQLAALGGGADVVFDAEGRRIGGARLTAVAVARPGERGRRFRLATDRDYSVVRCAQERLRALRTDWESGSRDRPNPDPDEPTPKGGGTGAGRAFSTHRYGMLRWGQLFTARQRVSMNALAAAVSAHRNEIGRSESVAEVLAMALGKVADFNCASARWRSSNEDIGNLFGRQVLPIVWDFAETNPTGTAFMGFDRTVRHVAQVVGHTAAGVRRAGTVRRADAAEHPLPDESVAVWFTDPPYYDAVPYADLADFFLVWLRRSLPGHSLLENSATEDEPLSPKIREIVQDETKREGGQPKDGAWFEKKMADAFREGRRLLEPDGVGSVVFAHKTTEGWEALLSGMIRGGWTITASWPVATEMGSRLRAMDSAALATSVHLVCRPRPEDAGVGDWVEIRRELPGRVSSWMERLQGEGVRGADLVFACIGPALELFSRYRAVETVDGTEVGLRSYLEETWATVGRAALQRVLGESGADRDALEPDGRLTALFLWTLQGAGETERNGGSPKEEGADNGSTSTSPGRFSLPYDVVRRFAQPMGIDLESWKGRIIEMDKGIVRLVPVVDRAKGIFGDGATNHASASERAEGVSEQRLLELDWHASPGADDARGNSPVVHADARILPEDSTTLDRVHAAMLLQSSGRSAALRTLLAAEVARGSEFLRLANALSALYPRGCQEKRLLDAMLLAVPR